MACEKVKATKLSSCGTVALMAAAVLCLRPNDTASAMHTACHIQLLPCHCSYMLHYLLPTLHVPMLIPISHAACGSADFTVSC